MHRLIKLFQQRSDQAYEQYVLNRNNALKTAKIDSPEWHAAVVRGADLKAKFETWAKAAELLRKEEITK